MLPVSLRKPKEYSYDQHNLTLYLAPPTMGPQLDLDAWRIQCFDQGTIEGGIDEREETALTAVLSAAERLRYDALRDHQRRQREWQAREEAVSNRADVVQEAPKPDELSDDDADFLADVTRRVRQYDPHITLIYRRMELAIANYALGEIACCLIQLVHEGETYIVDNFNEAVEAVKMLPVDVVNDLLDKCRDITRVSPAERRDSPSPSTSPQPTSAPTPVP